MTPDPDQGARWVLADPGPPWTLAEVGAYRYARSGPGEPDFAPAPVVERYAVWTQAGSADRCIRSARDALSTPHALELRVEARISDGPRVEMDLEVLDAGGSSLARAGYVRTGDALRWGRGRATDLGAEGAEGVEMDLPEGTLSLPLTRNYLGEVIVEAATRPGGEACVLVPDLTDPRSATALAPTLSTRAARRASSVAERISVGGREWLCDDYRFVGGPYGPKSSFRICRDSRRLVRYVFELSTGERWLAEWGEDA